jgi:hypothetical protein
MDNISYTLFTILLFLVGLLIILKYSKRLMNYTVEKFGVGEDNNL